jgi:hypothetical protein
MKSEYRIRCMVLLSVLMFCHLRAQDTIKKIVNVGDPINLRLVWSAGNHGIIQWQRSFDGTNWININDQISKDYFFQADSSSLYRAMVTSGSCNPFYSRLNKLTVFKLNGSLKSVSETSAYIEASIDVDETPIVEHGILFDSLASMNPASSKKIDSSTDWSNLHYSFQNLTPGKVYYARIYALTTTGSYILGNNISFTTIDAESLHTVDYTDTSARIWYKISGSVSVEEHGVFFSSFSDPDSGSTRVIGTRDTLSSTLMGIVLGSERYFADLTGLYPDSAYFIRPYLKSEGRYYLGAVQKIRTYSDYSDETIDTNPFTIGHKILWNNSSTSKKLSVSFGDYGRVKRIGNSDSLLLVYHGGPKNLDYINIYLRKSFDNGETWGSEEVIRNLSDYANQYYRFCNPELLYLKNGWLLLAYEANTIADENKSSVQILTSKDSGKTWEGPVMIRTGRSWEPSMVQLPNGEIELFYSSEADWWPIVNGSPVYQDIICLHSTDNGQTWSSPLKVAYYPNKRDGMPVPVLLQGNKGVVFGIETVGNSNSPYIIQRPLKNTWTLTSSNFDNSPFRWFAGDFGGHGGAPYILQLPTGETVLSVHRYRGGDWHQNNDMKVMIGDNNARNFEQLTTPYILPAGESAVNNSLFLKNSTTIVAISCRMMANGSGGIYWLEGTIVPK